MTTPPTPSLLASTLAVASLQLRRLVRGRKLRFGIAAVLLVVIGTVAARYAAETQEPAEVFRTGASGGFFHMLVYLLPFLFVSGAIAEEVEGRTFTYLALRPVSRAALATGKFIAGFGTAAALIVGGFLLLYLACFITTPASLGTEAPMMFRALLALLLLTFAYSAMCLLWGALAVEASGIVSALYLGVVEFAFSFVPFLKLISMNHHAMDIAGYSPEVSEFLQRFEVPVPKALACAIIVAVGLLFYGFATLVVRVSEYRTAKA